ncbi:MAG: CPBP family intramembrane metalloprotease [Burkholderiaceae bacterium]|nr:CPBP family intramembrane metalloprotease [Microbacteriaceae bacterium]
MDYAYHRLARSAPKYSWWKALVTGLVFVGYYLALSIVLVLFFVIGSFALPDVFGDFLAKLTTISLDLTDPTIFAFAIGTIALMLPALILARLTMGPRPLGLVSSVAGRVRWGWLGRCIPLALAVYGIVFALSFLVLDPALGAAPLSPTVTSTTLLLIVLALLLTPIQATAEEYVFRGYLMQSIGGWLKHPLWAILLPVPLFAIGHNYDIWGLLDVSIFAIVAGWLTWRTGGLEAAIVAHVVNNTTLFILGAFGLTDLNATEGSPVGLLVTAAIMAGYSALVLLQARRTGLVTRRTVVEEPGEPVDPVDDAALPVAAPQYGEFLHRHGVSGGDFGAAQPGAGPVEGPTEWIAPEPPQR